MVATPRIQCIFCDQLREQGQEHIWPDWIGNRLPRRAMLSTFRYTGDGQVHRGQAIAFTLTIPNVCQRCNGRWMRRIENRVIPVAEPMIFGMQPAQLSSAAQQTIASWAYLRALVLQYASDPTGLPPWRYHEIYRRRGRPLTTSFIWIGALRNPDPSGSYFGGMSLDFGNVPFIGQTEPEAYVATMAVGNLVMRVLLYSPLLQRAGHLGRVDNGPFGPSLAPVWLPNPGGSQWPPIVLDFESYARLVSTRPTAFIAN
jgi:hypothetical protein